MALRMGELMVVIRAEDFASRTLRRVGGELAGMSRLQAQSIRNQQKLSSLGGREAELRTVLRYTNAVKTAEKARQRLERVEHLARGGARDPISGRFTSRADVIAAQDNLLRVQGQATRTAKAVTELEQQMSRLPRSIQSMKNDLPRLVQNLQSVRTETRGLAQEQQLLSKAIPIERWDNFGRALSGVGRTMQLFGAISTVAFGAAANQAADFATEATNAATQMRDLTVQTRAEGLDQIRQRTDELTNGLAQSGVEVGGVLDLMNQYPASANEMSAAAYDIFSSMQLQKNGITDVAAGMGLLETANKIAVAGNVDLETATNSMITTLNNFARQGEDTSEVLDTMFDIVRFGRMRLSDFDVMMNKIAPAAAGAGQSLEDVGGAMAFLTEVMPSQRMVATGISRLIEAFERPEIAKGLEAAGISVENLLTEGGKLPDLLREIKNELDPKNASEFFRLISARGRGGGRGVIFTQEGRRAFNQIMNNFDGYLERQQQIEQNTGEFGTSLEANLESIGNQWKIFTNQLRVVVLLIGQEAVPVFAEIGEQIEKLVVWFQALDPATRELIVQWGVYIAVGTLLAGILASITGSLITLASRLALVFAAGSGTVGILNKIWFALSRIAGLAALAIILKVAWKGEATAIDFLLGAAFGAAAGSIFGPAGAILGAVTVPVILALITEQRKSGMKKAFDEYQEGVRDEFKSWSAFGMAERFTNALPDMLVPIKPQFDKANFDEQWNQLLAHHKKVQGIMNRAPTEKVADFYIKNLRKELKGIDPEIRRLFEKFGPQLKNKSQTTDWFQQMRNQIKGGTKEQKTFLDQLEKWYNAQLEGADSTIAKQKELQNVVEQTTEQTISSMRNMFSQMLQMNEQAMGELFRGPWLSSESFDLAKEWGITPRIEDMIVDMQQQNQRFAAWRASLDKLFKKGLPPELIQSLQQMGPEEGQAFVDNLLNAKPGQVQKIISVWKTRNKQIQEATKMDFTRQVNEFRKAGEDMGKAMIDGFQDAGVGSWFDTWVKSQFPDIINAAISTAKTEWKKTQAAEGRGGPVPPTAPTGDGKKDGDKSGATVNKTVNVTVHTDSSDAAREEDARKTGYIVGNKVQKVMP